MKEDSTRYWILVRRSNQAPSKKGSGNRSGATNLDSDQQSDYLPIVLKHEEKKNVRKYLYNSRRKINR